MLMTLVLLLFLDERQLILKTFVHAARELGQLMVTILGDSLALLDEKGS